MSEYDNPRDDPASVTARREQDDPYVQHLVVRRDPARPIVEVLSAAVRAVCDCETKFADHPRYRDDYRAWSERSFRKVTLRAKANEWPRIEAMDAGLGIVDGERLVAAIPPGLRSARDPYLGKIQAWTVEVSELPPTVRSEPGVAMRFVLNGAVAMRAGKLTAQVCHAVLLCREGWRTRASEAFAAWDAGGRPSRFYVADAETWQRLKMTAPCAIIRDAGITEVVPGSETVMAIVPGEGGEEGMGRAL